MDRHFKLYKTESTAYKYIKFVIKHIGAKKWMRLKILINPLMVVELHLDIKDQSVQTGRINGF